MVRVVDKPKLIQAHGEPPKQIKEFIGRANTATPGVSIARMVSPTGWQEPGQTTEFDEFTVVLRGSLRVETRVSVHDIKAGQAVIVSSAEWVRYSTPGPGGAGYISVCVPAFSPETVDRDA